VSRIKIDVRRSPSSILSRDDTKIIPQMLKWIQDQTYSKMLAESGFVAKRE
jgi:hypothetical protein